MPPAISTLSGVAIFWAWHRVLSVAKKDLPLLCVQHFNPVKMSIFAQTGNEAREYAADYADNKNSMTIHMNGRQFCYGPQNQAYN